MKIDPSSYVNSMIKAIDQFISENLNNLRAYDLYEFYRTLFNELKKFFGGSWGFDGVTEVLIFRLLHHLIGEKEKVIEVTSDLRAYYYEERNIVLGAGLPLKIGERKIWPDIIVYESEVNDPLKIVKLKSVLEIKAYPQGGLKSIKNMVERLKMIHNYYPDAKLALIVYSLPVKNKNKSRIWKYLHRALEGEETIPSYIDVVLLSERHDRVTKVFKLYVSN